MDCSPPGSSICGVLEARILVWVVKSLSCVQLLCDPVDCSLPGSSVHGDSPGDLADPGIEPASLMSPALVGGFFTISTTRETQYYFDYD